MENNSNVVTCVYCEFFKFPEVLTEFCFLSNSKGECKKHNKTRFIYDEICDLFEIKSGVYTSKDYPNKEKRKPIPFESLLK